MILCFKTVECTDLRLIWMYFLRFGSYFRYYYTTLASHSKLNVSGIDLSAFYLQFTPLVVSKNKEGQYSHGSALEWLARTLNFLYRWWAWALLVFHQDFSFQELMLDLERDAFDNLAEYD